MARRFFYLVMILAMTLSLSTPASAKDASRGNLQQALQAGAKSYIVVLQLDTMANSSGLATNRTAENSLISEHNSSLASAGASEAVKIHDYTHAFNGYSAILTAEQVEAIRQQKNTVLVLEDQMRYPQTDSSPEFLGLTVKHGAYDSGFTGEGVVVGIIDTGIWPEHPSFADDGSYAAPPTGPLPCEFGNTAWNPNDAPFTCNNKLIGAYEMLDTYRALTGATSDEFRSARDDNGHGTHTASTAAGNACVEVSLYGAPFDPNRIGGHYGHGYGDDHHDGCGNGHHDDDDRHGWHHDDDDAVTISGIAPRAHIIAYKGLGNLGGYTSDLAAAIDQAVADGVDVINYSIGGGAGGVSADELAFLFAADAGVFVATSAGNSGPNPSTLGDPATKPWVTTVGASTQDRFWQGTIILGNGRRYTGASITPSVGWSPLVDGATLGNPWCDPAVPFSSSVAGKIVVCQRGLVARVAKSLAVFNAGGVGMIMYENSDTGNLFSDTHWVPSIHVDLTPGTAIKAYIAANPARAKAKLQTDQVSEWKSAPSMTDFSSRGPNPVAPDIIKPDVTAPGIQIMAGNSPFPDAGNVPGELFQSIAGTSMSSPHVAGIFALLKQAHPEWTPAMAKSALMTTAHQDVKDNDRVSKADPFDMGAGHVDPGGKWDKGSINEPGLVYDAGLYEYYGFMCDAFPTVFLDPVGTCAFLDANGIPTQAEDLNYPSIGISQVPGTKTVIRTVTSVANGGGKVTYKAKVVAPAGFKVTVSPSTIKLGPGESATFSVTVTNVSAPIGEWRFGSLTWKGSSYEVYSPIAVKGALFEGPAEVSGSYQVLFGYTGPFTATARGLAPATSFTHAVNTGDFICESVVVPAGSTYARFALFDADTSPAADIDLYAFLGATQVGQSGTGTSEEVINLLNPAAGKYDVCLDGYATANPSTTTLFTWILGAADAGNMTVSAPASATIGTVGNINLTFTGLTPGVKYLGSVAYSGVAGLPNPTIVRVDP
ncbi:MAG: hypothetical protein MHPDNHAH_00620 [Anaerolineales bacterium]|nr:hypothetical protein [Anaerolineales bacterium]